MRRPRISLHSMRATSLARDDKDNAMDFELPEELKLLQNTVRTFVDRELIPIEMSAMDGPSLRPEIRADLERKAKDLGLWLLDVPDGIRRPGPRPARHGRGVGGAHAHRRAAAARSRRVRTGREADPVHAHGAQKEKYLYPVLRGEKKTAFAQSEPDAGSDPAPCAPPRCARATTTSSTATSAGSPRPRTPISCSWSPPPIAAKAAAAA